jgi:hypothetical protein
MRIYDPALLVRDRLPAFCGSNPANIVLKRGRYVWDATCDLCGHKWQTNSPRNPYGVWHSPR